MGKENTKAMTVDDIKARVEKVRENINDQETAHWEEDAMLVAVLRAIADGAENPAELAREALVTQDWDMTRWYA